MYLNPKVPSSEVPFGYFCITFGYDFGFFGSG